jgi:sugar (pentulose or hexulose) kinase
MWVKEEENCPPFQNTIFFINQQPYHKSNHLQQALLEDLVLYFAKGYHPLSSIEMHIIWLCGNVGMYNLHPTTKW